MSIKLDEERKVYPANKFNKIGDHITVAVVRTETLPMTVYGTGEPMLGKNNQPRTQTRVTGLVIDATCTIKAGEGATRPAELGELVSLYMKGLSRWEFFEAKKTLEGGLQVGDVLRWTYTGEKPGQAPGTTKKVYTVDLKHPSEKNAARTEKCEEIYAQLANAPAPEAQSAAPVGEYDPFEDE